MVELYAIYDKVSATYGAPIAFANKAVAIRYLKNQFVGQTAYLALDSDIYYFGKYDQFTGKFELEESPQFVLNIGEVLSNE